MLFIVKDNDYFCNMMSIRRDIPQIIALRDRVETRFGKRLAVHADFLSLVDVIERQQREHISETTIERVWGYSTRGYDTVSLRTLDVLSEYACGVCWEKFCEQLSAQMGVDSELYNVDHIATSDLAVGERLQIGWLPDRLCTVRYLGDNRFVAEQCSNAKIQAGDTFSCLQFALGMELQMTDFCRCNEPNTEALSYIVGRQNGLTTLRLIR